MQVRVWFLFENNIDSDRPYVDETGDQGFSLGGFLALWIIYRIWPLYITDFSFFVISI